MVFRGRDVIGAAVDNDETGGARQRQKTDRSSDGAKKARLPARCRPAAMRWAVIISRSWIFRACSRTSPAPSCSRRRAIRIALGESRVTALVFPSYLQEAAYEDPLRKHGSVHSGLGFVFPRVVPYQADLQRAADVLNASDKVAICMQPMK